MSMPLLIKRETLAKFLPDHKSIKQFEDLFTAVNDMDLDTIQFISSTDTITENKAFCDGSGYIVTMPVGPTSGESVTVFNVSDSGFITISQVEGADFNLYYGETLDMTYTGTEWQA